MKFLVFFISIFLSLVQCIARKGWNAASYKDEDDSSMGWSGYLKRLSLIFFMVSGIILYYVPNSRFYFCRACHEMIDFVADGLKTALNTTDNEYVTGDDSSSIYSEQHSEQTFGKQASCLSSEAFAEDRFLNVYNGTRGNRVIVNFENSNENGINRKSSIKRRKHVRNEDNSHRNFNHKDKNHNFDKFSTCERTLELPFETIQIYPDRVVDLHDSSKSSNYCPSERDSDTSGTICRNFYENRHNIFYTADKDNSGLESEPTEYPDDESFYDRTSDVERLNSYLYIKREIEQSLKTQNKLEEQLIEFDRTLRNLYSSFSQKKSKRNVDKDEYAVRLIGTILQSVKSNFGDVVDSKKNINERCYDKSKVSGKMSIIETPKKLITSEYKDRKSNRKAVEAKHRRKPCPMSSSVRKNVHRSNHRNIRNVSSSRNRYKSTILMPEESVQVPIIPNRVKPMIERAVRWFYGGCTSTESEMPAVGNRGIGEHK